MSEFLVLVIGIIILGESVQSSSSAEWGYFFFEDPPKPFYFKEYVFRDVPGKGHIICPNDYRIDSLVYSTTREASVAPKDDTYYIDELLFNHDTLHAVSIGDKLNYYLQLENDEHGSRDHLIDKTELEIPYVAKDVMEKPLPSSKERQLPQHNIRSWSMLDVARFLDESEVCNTSSSLVNSIIPPHHLDPPRLLSFRNQTHLKDKYQVLLDYIYNKSGDASSGVEIGLCRGIVHCLGHQGCNFAFGSSFCEDELRPGYSRTMKLMLRCSSSRNERVEEASQMVAKEIQQHQRERQVRYQSFWLKSVLTIRSDIESLTHSLNMVSVKNIFQASCPINPSAAGFLGSCIRDPEAPQNTIQAIWPVLSRAKRQICRDAILNNYCALQYNEKGLCKVPDLHSKRDKNGHSFFETPENVPRPGKNMITKLNKEGLQRLIPARIGFLLLIHTAPDTTIRLLRLIYRPIHYYVIHVDKAANKVRKDLKLLVKNWFPKMNNIRILPSKRSFKSIWGSYDIVRAELEGMEELLRMGQWDFFINLSGADLPLRTVEDLADHLADIRGMSIMKKAGTMFSSFIYNAMVKKSWYSCDGFVYKVAKRSKIPNGLDIYVAAQWKILDRGVTETLVTRENRPQWLKNIQFFMQTSEIPDECYVPTIFWHQLSKHRNAILDRLYTFVPRFRGQLGYDPCRQNSDLCGNGPVDIDNNDVTSLYWAAHSYFFARKFSYSLTHPARQLFAPLAERDEYNQEISRSLPNRFVWALANLAVEELGKSSQRTLKVTNIIKLSIIPNQVHEMHGPHSQRGQPSLIKAKLSPHFPLGHTCYPEGHIRLVRISTTPPPQNRQPRPNAPQPYEPAGGHLFWIEFGMQFHNVTGKCSSVKSQKQATYISWSENDLKQSSRKKLEVTIIGPHGQPVCRLHADIESFVPDKNGTSANVLVLGCPNLRRTSEGLWTIQFKEVGPNEPYIYSKSILLLEVPISQYSADIHFNDNYMKQKFSVNDVGFLRDIEKLEKTYYQ